MMLWSLSCGDGATRATWYSYISYRSNFVARKLPNRQKDRQDHWYDNPISSSSAQQRANNSYSANGDECNSSF